MKGSLNEPSGRLDRLEADVAELRVGVREILRLLDEVGRLPLEARKAPGPKLALIDGGRDT